MKNTLPALTGIRYIAAMMVLIEHLAPQTGNELLDSLIRQLNVGVTIFFVLSGFLISYRYQEQYIDHPTWKKSYLVKRFARIYPMYALVTCVTFFFLYRSSRDHRGLSTTFFLNLTLLRGFSEKHVYTGVSQGWTLTVEEVFYLLAPFIFFMNKKIALWVQTLFFLLCGFVLICLTGLMNVKFMWICTFFGRSFEFICGIYLYHLVKNGSFRPRIKVTTIAVFLLVALLFLLCGLSYSPYKYGIQNPIGLGVNNYLVPIAVALLFWGLIHERTWLQRLLSTKVFEVLGKSSYTLYLIHYGVFAYLVETRISSNFFVMTAVLQVAAIIGWKYVEEPLNRKIKAFFSEKRSSVPQLKTVKE